MRENPRELIYKELSQSGAQPQVTPLLLELDTHRITPDSEVAEEEFLFTMHGVPCFPRRDLSAVTGQAKSGKTFFTSMLMACCACREVLALRRVGEEPLRVIWLDTEQSAHSTKDILCHRVAGLCEGGMTDEMFYIFNVRDVSCADRMELLTEGIVTYHPDLVIVDGVRDLVRDINDGVKSQELIERLTQLADEARCCIVCVLHQNRSGDNRGLRGWLGTELTNKAFEVYSCEKLRQQGVFCVEQTHTRKYDMEQALYYTISDNGLPQLTTRPATERPRDEQGKFVSRQEPAPTLNHDYIIDTRNGSWQWDLRHLFSDAMGSRASWGYNDLMDEVMRLANIKWKRYYAKLFEKAEERRVIKKELDRNGRVVILLLPDSGAVP